MIFDEVIKYFSFFGAFVAIILGILKIIELFRNKPILKGHGSGGIKHNNTKTALHVRLEITNIGRQPTIIKEILYDILNDKKQQINVHSRLVNMGKMKKQLFPNEYTSIEFQAKIHKKLPGNKFFFKVMVRASHSTKSCCTFLIPLTCWNSDEMADWYYKEVEDGMKKGRLFE